MLNNANIKEIMKYERKLLTKDYYDVNKQNDSGLVVGVCLGFGSLLIIGSVLCNLLK